MGDVNDSFTHRMDRRFLFRIKLMYVLSVVLAFVNFFVVAIIIVPVSISLAIIVGLPLCFGPAILPVFLESRAIKRYRCPVCHRHIGNSEPAYLPWTITFACPDCRITWDTGRSTPKLGDSGP